MVLDTRVLDTIYYTIYYTVYYSICYTKIWVGWALVLPPAEFKTSFMDRYLEQKSRKDHAWGSHREACDGDFYMYIYIQMYVYIYTHTYMYMHVFTHMHVCVYIYTCVHIYIYIPPQELWTSSFADMDL